MRTPLVALLLAAASAAPSAAAADDPVAEAVRQHGRAALAQASSPRGAAHLIRLYRLRDEVEELAPVAAVLTNVSERRSADPFTRFTARLLLADVERARGRMPRVQELVRSLGFVTDFYVAGSFDNEGKAGCAVDHGPESNLDLKATYPAKGRQAGWRRIPVHPSDGYVNLGAMLRPDREAVGYAVTVLQSPEEAVTTLGVGTSGAFRLWVNGQLAASEDRYNRPRPDQVRVAVRLRRGPNRVLLKVCQSEGPFGFYLRSESPSVVPALGDTLPPLGKGPGPAPARLPTLTSALEKEVQARPKEAALRGEYATVLSFFRAFDERDHSDRVQAGQAAELAPADAELQLLAAALHDEDQNLRRKHLEAAVKAAPRHLLARHGLAQHELARNHPERALRLAAELVNESPRFIQARLLLARAHESLGESARAVGVLDQAFREFPRAPGVVREAARVSHNFDRPQEALDRLRVMLALRYDDGGSRRQAASILADLARVPEAVRELEVQLEQDPFDLELRLRLAGLQAANGRAAGADRAFALAQQLSPDEPEVHERHGRALLQADRRPEAVAAFERALQLRPQNPGLKEAVRSLKGEETLHGADLLVDVKAIAPQADAFGGEDAVFLSDSTYVRVQPSGLSSRLHQVAVKVFNQRGVDAFRTFPITYSPNRQEVRVNRARVIKADGAVVDSYGESDRVMNEPWSGMYYDTRAKVLSFPQLAAGDVLELQYRLEDTAQENLLSDYWGDVEYLQGTSPKLRYQYFVDMPASRPLYWNKESLPPGVEHAQQPAPDGRVLYRWTARNLSKVVPEPDMPGWAEVVPTLHVSTYRTWEDVGRYYWGLVRDQVIPNEEIRKVTASVLEGVDRKDERAVIRAIYGFVVTNTRYVALEFGIHGYKPYRVDRVLARRFGDCKDKASLIHAMLKVAGVESRLVLLRMRNLGALGREPASLAAFNHAIAYVPKYQLFLDGTAEFHGSRELPSADRAASILLVEPDGPSTFTTTPEASAEDNATTLSLNVALSPEGSASTSGTSQVSGQTAPSYRRSYQAASTRKSLFERGWARTFPGLKVKDVRLEDLSKLEQDVSMSFELEIPRYAEVLAGGALRFSPFGSARGYTQTYAPLTERRFDLAMQAPWVERLRFAYQLPPGFTAQELPPPAKEESPFGRLAMTCQAQGAEVGCELELALTVSRVKAQDYPAFRAFLGRVDQVFSRKVVAQGPPPGVRQATSP